MAFSEDTLELLGYHQLLSLIAGYTQSALGREQLLGLRPIADLKVIRRHRSLYEDLLRLREETRSLPGLHFEDIRELLQTVRPGDSILDGAQLLMLRGQLEVVAGVLQFAASLEAERYTALSSLTAGLDSADELRNRLLRSIDADGSVLDGASAELREIRREQLQTERRLQRVLEGMLHSQNFGEALQDRFVTRRNGRYVVPVKRDSRSMVPGLVHDVSSSGQTLFVEPGATLGMGNELAELAARERQEVRRILMQLSAMVRERVPALAENQRRLALLDGAAAVARWAADYQCVLPAFGGFLKLRNARHPLLASQFRRDTGRVLVPLDMELPPHTRAMAVTGSNTGGKTVVLKTVGILVLAAQSGLPVPVDGDSLFECFDAVYADIGDNQSIAENLSTFSAHVANMAQILKASCEGRSLILLDELGSGTDPQEGGALACAMLEEFSHRNALTLLTTHLGVVKNFVHRHSGMVNASVRFNEETLQPEYVLTVGRPGASHALQIARRLGLPPVVMQRAESYLSSDELQLEDILARMEQQQRQLAERNAAAAAAQRDAEAQREEVRQQLRTLKRERRQLLNDAYNQAGTLVANARRELENAVREVREAARRQGVEADVKTAAARARTLLEEKGRALQTGESQTRMPPAVKPLPVRQLEVGKKIWVERLGCHGRIAACDEHARKIEVEVNGMRFTLKASELFPAQIPDSPAERETRISFNVPRFTGQTCHELNVVGLRVDDAIARVEGYINDCVLAGLHEVRIVHGFGTGRLRNGLHQWLERQRLVKAYRQGVDQRDAGGGGVTIISL